MKIQLTKKFDLDAQMKREVVQKSFKTFKLYVFNNITRIYDHCGTQKFTLNIGHNVIFDVNQRMRNFVYMK